jgi:hypothetical protein
VFSEVDVVREKGLERDAFGGEGFEGEDFKKRISEDFARRLLRSI